MEGKGEFVDFYRILECDKNAKVEEIKKNYQRLALTLHPDKSRANESESFLLLQKAWAVIRDPQSRKLYDAELTCYEHSEILLYDKITLNDMVNDIDTNVYTYNCRCGGIYILEVDDLLPSKVNIGCDECSFSIEVTL